jgi:hypothetical protein
MRVNKEDHIKTIYDKTADRFYYLRAVNKQPFRFGCDTFWEFCEYMLSGDKKRLLTV